jgi:dTDP-4-dehydrorhamnose reductase
MADEEKVLYTGGNGLLGRELKKLLLKSFFPSHLEFDVLNYSQMEDFLHGKNIKTLVHGAAFTSPPRVDKNPIKALETNIIGTSNVVRLCSQEGIRLVYISTDYVFKGDQGNYSEEDPVFPVNKYAWSKLGGECAVRMYDNSLIVRTSFGENQFPYEKAFIDQYTSRESVSTFARKLVEIIGSDLKGTIHVGSPRRSVLEYARSLGGSKVIDELSIHDVNFKVPEDTSLNCEKYRGLFGDKK